MSEQPRPVRAWAEYEEWSVFTSTCEGNWDFVVTPKGATGEAAAGTTVSFETAWKGRYIEAPLRSLRVLLSTGHEATLSRDTRQGGWWYMRLIRCGRPEFGRNTAFEADTDVDAVARALAEAVAWVSEQSGVKA